MLFLQTLELSPGDVEQGSALVCLLGALKGQPSWWRAFLAAQGGYPLIARVLASPKAAKGPELLKAIFTVSMSPAGGVKRGESLEENLAYVAESAIEDPNVLTQFLAPVGLWRGSGGGEWWERGLSLLAGALDEDGNPFAAFNVLQLNRTRLFRSLLLGILELWQEEETAGGWAPTEHLALSVVSLARALLGNPAQPLLLREIHDFLFLSHPAPSTYLNYRVPPTSPWLAPASIAEKPQALLDAGHQSPLVHKLRQYLQVFGPLELRTHFEAAHHSVIAVRTEFFKRSLNARLQAEAAAADPVVPPLLEASESFAALPDLVCDIAASSQGCLLPNLAHLTPACHMNCRGRGEWFGV